MAQPKVKETTIQNAILSFLKVRHILHNRINNGQFTISETGPDKFGRNRRKNRAVRCNTLNGIADIEVFARIVDSDGNSILPVIIYLEVKTPTGRQSKHQKLFQSRIEDANGFYFVVRSVEDVKKAFENTLNKIKNISKEYKLEFLKAFTLAETA